MKNGFFKFPSTPHMATLEGVNIRGDKMLSEQERVNFLQHEILVEEKVDGANLGMSFNSEGNILLQNRGAYIELSAPGQWKKLAQWLNPRVNALFDVLTDRYILFGEWCYARHSVFYNSLPDWFLAFDVYDKHRSAFLSAELRNSACKNMEITTVPFLGFGRFSFPEIKQILSQSKISDEAAEGVYLRIDKNDLLSQRAKLVRPAFIQACEDHWSRSRITPNKLIPAVW